MDLVHIDIVMSRTVLWSISRRHVPAVGDLLDVPVGPESEQFALIDYPVLKDRGWVRLKVVSRRWDFRNGASLVTLRMNQ